MCGGICSEVHHARVAILPDIAAFCEPRYGPGAVGQVVIRVWIDVPDPAVLGVAGGDDDDVRTAAPVAGDPDRAVDLEHVEQDIGRDLAVAGTFEPESASCLAALVRSDPDILHQVRVKVGRLIHFAQDSRRIFLFPLKQHLKTRQPATRTQRLSPRLNVRRNFIHCHSDILRIFLRRPNHTNVRINERLRDTLNPCRRTFG